MNRIRLWLIRKLIRPYEVWYGPGEYNQQVWISNSLGGVTYIAADSATTRFTGCSVATSITFSGSDEPEGHPA